MPLPTRPGPLDDPWRSRHHQGRGDADDRPVTSYSDPLSHFGQNRPAGLVESLSMLAVATVSIIIMITFAWVHHHYGPLDHGDHIRLTYVVPIILAASSGVIGLYYRTDYWVTLVTAVVMGIILISLPLWVGLHLLLF